MFLPHLLICNCLGNCYSHIKHSLHVLENSSFPHFFANGAILVLLHNPSTLPPVPVKMTYTSSQYVSCGALSVPSKNVLLSISTKSIHSINKDSLSKFYTPNTVSDKAPANHKLFTKGESCCMNFTNNIRSGNHYLSAS